MIKGNGQSSETKTLLNLSPQINGNGHHIVHVNKHLTNGHPANTEQENTQSSGLNGQRGFSPQHNAICTHLYQVGFLSGAFSDVILHVPKFSANNVYKLHSLVLARSPFFHHLLTTSLNPHELILNLEDPNISDEGLVIALGYLYAGFPQLQINPTNALNVLATAYLLQLEDLCAISTEVAKKNISRQTVLAYTQFVDQADGVGYGAYTADIRESCFDFLTGTLPKQTEAFISGKSENYLSLVEAYVELPFDWLKRSIESQNLHIPSDMDRYNFAKEVVSRREKRRNAGKRNTAGEESVVLAFGTKVGGRVTLVRKPPKAQKRTLWRAPMTDH
ncbi:hypothetical protein K493DRAFT_291290 [Basidiobolus meristosporus CBS 931.73]|uniref:BTB domain-containing protein n=1 Tax=Basidiobolus meristosporus CBS 931.73 TaxID=1314790 RepID=A0A1Y1XM28_9FUNG|nr:hypothetical protein K493DRAFT_291290 [Basidiobolus meristosporus CBS 931.73]|eukprot:ORX86394.1 hypothetical protein K493DRAFT_291290 [Basidiobolus meristosporus CBS 931.73]